MLIDTGFDSAPFLLRPRDLGVLDVPELLLSGLLGCFLATSGFT